VSDYLEIAQEDLVYLAEMREIEAMMPSEADWDALAAAYPPPQKWFNEGDKLS